MTDAAVHRTQGATDSGNVAAAPVSVFPVAVSPGPLPPTWPGRRAFLVGLLAAGLHRPRVAVSGDAGHTLLLQPLGPMPAADLNLITRALGFHFGFRIERLPPAGMPPEAYFLPRQRYRAEIILDGLLRQTNGRDFILGVTALDISTTKDDRSDWGILGLGTIGGRSAVVSSFRCKRRAAGARHATLRLAKMSVHEVGHNLGLPHCPRPGCLMEDARGSVSTCDRATGFCAGCRALLAARGVPVKDTAFRWA